MPRIKNSAIASGHSILIVDDDENLLQTLSQLLQFEGHMIFSARNGLEAVQLCQEHEIHLMLLDYFMPGMTGEDVVREVRRFNSEIQIMLQTGYASDKPPRQMLRELDIQAYHDKSEGPEKLLVLIDAALKAFRYARALRESRDGLQYILDAAPKLHRLQPVEELMEGVLTQLQGLLGFSGTFVATVPTDTQPDGLIATTSNTALDIRLATGRFKNVGWQDLGDEDRSIALQALQVGKVQVGSLLALPLVLAERTLGVVLVDHQLQPSADLTLLEMFASQASVAIENVRLYELATVDSLTGLCIRRHWFHLFETNLRLAARHHFPLSVLMLDIDHFKVLNDNYGHMAGDEVLRVLGHQLVHMLRKTDIVGRYGGEEIIIALPQTDHQAALATAEKLRAEIQSLEIDWRGQRLPVRVSIGVSTFPGEPPVMDETPLMQLRDELIHSADLALYSAKVSGRNRVASADLNEKEAVSV